MIIKDEHFRHIEKSINDYLAWYGKEKIIAMYETGDFERSEKVKDLQKRFCFDLLYACKLSAWICDNIYPYACDIHIYTALKAICPKVNRRY